MHSYMRCKYAFLEDTPTIKGYEERDWAEKSPDALNLAIEASLQILEGVHQRWTYFFEHILSFVLVLCVKHNRCCDKH